MRRNGAQRSMIIAGLFSISRSTQSTRRPFFASCNRFGAGFQKPRRGYVAGSKRCWILRKPKLRSGENPAAWRGHLALILPKRQKLSRGHHAAMPYAEVPAFIGKLREVESIPALALEFAILTAARSGEVLGARGTNSILTPRSGSFRPPA